MEKSKIKGIVWPLTLFLFALLTFSCSNSGNSNNNGYVSFKKVNDGFTLVAEGTAAPIIVDENDHAGVLRVANLFAEDVERVSGVKPELKKYGGDFKTELAVIVGTIGKSSIIDQLIQQNKINVDDVEGNWENSLIEVVENPVEGVSRALVIVGSDKRGTIYGLFDVSGSIGVSPWYWWADVPAQKNENVYIKKGRYNLGEPKVKYRGIFLNDEEPALGRWAVENYGGFNHQFYEKVFELMLRLKANYMWPAMWWASFNSDDPLNREIADEMGIVMGTSHHEPMDRAHAEWKQRANHGEWNYETNPEGLREFWREGIERIGDREVIVNMAMRGDGDVEMSPEANTELLEKIVIDQRKIIEEVTGKPASQTPQMWALYKEVQEYYDKGMRVPDDVTLLICDDNWGNVRMLPDPEAPERSGGYGLYYHFDFVGGPRSYKWINVSPIPKIWEQLNLTYRHGVERLWLVNVGDLKPMELPISFFLDYAWDPDAITLDNLDEYTTRWAEQQFGKKYAKKTAEILDLYTKYNGRRTPEMLDATTYSLTNFREFERVTADYVALADKAEKLYQSLPEEMKPAFYQLAYQPTVACANLYEMYYAHALNKLYARQGRAATSEMAEKVKTHFEKDAAITEYFHTDLMDGKWNHMMAQPRIGYYYWNQPRENIMPRVAELEIPEDAALGVSVEGSELAWPGGESKAVLPAFDSFNDQSFYIEIFNKGQKPFSYEISSDDPWVTVAQSEGSIEQQERIEIDIDWVQLSLGKNTTNLTISASTGEEVIVEVIANKLDEENIEGFVERNGYVAIEAPNYTREVSGKNIEWKVIPGMGRTSSAISSFPVTKAVKPLTENNPRLEYDIYLTDAPVNGQVTVQVITATTLNFKNGSGLHYAVSIDDQKPQMVNLHEGTEVQDWKYPQWFNRASSEKVMIKTVDLPVKEMGKHTLKIWMVDNGIVYQRLIVETEEIPYTYLGPPESTIAD